MVMKGYSAFPKAPALLWPHHQTVQCHIQDTHWEGGGLIPLQRCSQCVLQRQPTGQSSSCSIGKKWVKALGEVKREMGRKFLCVFVLTVPGGTCVCEREGERERERERGREMGRGREGARERRGEGERGRRRERGERTIDIVLFVGGVVVEL